MSKRKKVSVIAAHDRYSFNKYRKIVPILTGTCFTPGSDQARAIGVISITGSAASVTGGKCYICIDTAGTGKIMTD